MGTRLSSGPKGKDNPLFLSKYICFLFCDVKYEIKPEAGRFKHPTLTKMPSFSVYVSLFPLVPVFLPHSSISASVHRHLGQGLSQLWKISGIDPKYIPAATCLAYLHTPIPGSPTIGWLKIMERNPLFQKTQTSSNCGFAGIALLQEST